MTRRTLPLCLVLLFAAPGCDDRGAERADGAVATRPPVELDDADVQRVISALQKFHQLNGEVLAEAAERGETLPPLPHSAGIATYHGARALPILHAHGFESAEQFDGTLAYVMQALQRTLGPQAGHDLMDRAYQIRSRLAEAREELAEVERDRSLSLLERDQRLGALRLQIREHQDRLEELEELGENLSGGFDTLPPSTLESVARHRDELMRLFAQGAALENR